MCNVLNISYLHSTSFAVYHLPRKLKSILSPEKAVILVSFFFFFLKKMTVYPIKDLKGRVKCWVVY